MQNEPINLKIPTQFPINHLVSIRVWELGAAV